MRFKYNKNNNTAEEEEAEEAEAATTKQNKTKRWVQYGNYTVRRNIK